MSNITEGYLVRHYQGTRGARDAALLDIAQDHALYLLHQAGLFDRGLVFKGGTSLRKYRAGTTGRFSTDLDFAAPEEDLAIDTLSVIESIELDGFAFHATDLGDDGRRAKLIVDTPFGRPDLDAKIELARHPLSLAPEMLEPMPMAVHKTYNFNLPTIPVVARPEAIAEKLARFRRVPLARDLYDLAWYSAHPFDESLVRRLWVLKTYRDIVEDKRGDKPIDSSQILGQWMPADFNPADIGYLIGTVNIPGWLATVQGRFTFLTNLDENELRWCEGNPRDAYEVTQALATIEQG